MLTQGGSTVMHQGYESASARRAPWSGPADPGRAPRGRRRHLAPGVVGAIVAALVLALSAGAAPASAAQVVPERTLLAAHRLTVTHWHPPATTGQVASVDGDTATGSCGTSGATGSFTLTDRKATTVTVDVTSSTAFAGWNM
ncbi:MAG TPA: hypothetical protein VEH82_11225, partial [Acidimicrobiales bacterium]|nr:hypothetical protein [Acidimicrobiales bacterium]